MKTKLCLFSLVHKIVAVVIILFLNISCGENALTETEIIIPDRTPGDPFYTGTIRLIQLPTSDNPDRDLIIDMNVTFKPDSNGYWPAMYNKQINRAKVTWRHRAFYENSSSLLFISENETIDSLITLNPIDSHKSVEVNRLYRLRVPSSLFSQYSQISEQGYLTLVIHVAFIGEIISDDSLNGLTYPCIDVIEYTPAIGNVYLHTMYTNIESPFTIIP